MADDLEENFIIEDSFKPALNAADEDEDDESVTETETEKPTKKKNPPTRDETNGAAKKRKRKNLGDILELKKDQLNKSSYATNEFVKLITDHVNKKLSSVEKKELNLMPEDSDDVQASAEYMRKRLLKMLLKRAKTHRLTVESQFHRKMGRKLRANLKSKAKKSNRTDGGRSPFCLVLAQSAVRCIELQKKFTTAVKPKQKATFDKLNWLYAFAKHKKLNEQIEFINSKFARDKTYSLDVVYGTPQRVKQLIDSKCLSVESLKYVFVDYSYRDCKLKRIIDHDNIRTDLLELTFGHLLHLNRSTKPAFKFYLA